MSGHRRVTSGPGVPQPAAPYSPAVVAGDLCFISGQIAVDPVSGEFRSGTASEEAGIAISNVFAIARAAGFEPDEFAFVTILLSDIDDFPAVNDVYAAAFRGAPLPARMTYEVSALPLGAHLEVQAIAVRSRRAASEQRDPSGLEADDQ